MNKNSHFFSRIPKAIGYSIAGLKSAWYTETAFRQEVLSSFILFPVAFWLGNSGVERALLIGCLFIVLISELLNSSIEVIADNISEEWHPLVKRVKDIASAAVFISILNAVLIWTLLLWHT